MLGLLRPHRARLQRSSRVPPMPIFASWGAMITSQQPSRAAFPAKQKRPTIPIVGEPVRSERAKRTKVIMSRPAGLRGGVSTGQASAALSEDHQGPSAVVPPSSATVQSSCGPSRPGCPRRICPVVSQNHDSRAPSVKRLSIDRCQSGDQPVGWGELYQLFVRPPLSLCREHERSILDKRPGSTRSPMFSRAVR